MGSPGVVRSAAKALKPLSAAARKVQMLRQLVCSDAPEQALRYRGATVIAGVDEVGRGALFGPVVAAAVVLPRSMGSLSRAGLTDSKQLLRADRERLDRRIRRIAVAVSIGEADAETIDHVNIYQATRLAMLRAVEGLPVAPDHLLIDAMRIDHLCPQTKLIYGDALSLSIAAASVVAKVYRDARMRELDIVHPGYGLAAHKGYATPEHRRALKRHGPTPLHRRSFAPVRASDPHAVVDPNTSLDPDATLEAELAAGELFFDDGELDGTEPLGDLIALEPGDLRGDRALWA